MLGAKNNAIFTVQSELIQRELKENTIVAPRSQQHERQAMGHTGSPLIPSIKLL